MKFFFAWHFRSRGLHGFDRFNELLPLHFRGEGFVRLQRPVLEIGAIGERHAKEISDFLPDGLLEETASGVFIEGEHRSGDHEIAAKIRRQDFDRRIVRAAFDH